MSKGSEGIRSQEIPVSMLHNPAYWLGRIAEAAGPVEAAGPDKQQLRRIRRIRQLLDQYHTHQRMLANAELLACRNQSCLNKEEVLAVMAQGTRPRQTRAFETRKDDWFRPKRNPGDGQ